MTWKPSDDKGAEVRQWMKSKGWDVTAAPNALRLPPPICASCLGLYSQASCSLLPKRKISGTLMFTLHSKVWGT
jgi:hypothetical protein